MVFELDIWHAANDLIRRHHSKAVIQAARRIDECVRAGDYHSKDTWVTVLRAIEAMQRKEVRSSRPKPTLTLPVEARILSAK